MAVTDVMISQEFETMPIVTSGALYKMSGMIFYDLNAASYEGETGFAGFLCSTGGDDDQLGVFGDGVIHRCIDIHTFVEGKALYHVIGFSLEFILVQVDETHRFGYFLVEHGVGNSEIELSKSDN